MTYIKKIKLLGFKSFAKPTELVFSNKFSMIIGPNGSGKSNIADSLCFVLGKISAKGMRAEKSANLIYNGGKEGKAAKEAYVTISFDNSKNEFPIDDKEVNITRIIKQSGSSIYKINDEVRTRQQVIDLLSKSHINPDGHNIVLQGDITHFMEMKPEDRRLLIEEISGISVYEEKKNKALSELEKVDIRINEASIILTEREAHLKELRKDRDQALKFKDLESKIKNNKATSIHRQIKRKEELVNKSTLLYNKQKEDIDKINLKLEQIKDFIKNQRLKISELTKDLEEKGELEQIKLNEGISNIKENIVKLKSRQETCLTEIRRIKERNVQLHANSNEIDKYIETLQKSKQDKSFELDNNELQFRKLTSELENFKAKRGLNDLNEIAQEIETIDKEITSLESKKNELLTKVQEVSNNMEVLKYQHTEVNNKIKSLESVRNSVEVKTLRKKLDNLDKDYIKTQQEINLISKNLNNSLAILKEERNKLNILEARQFTRNGYIRFNNAIKKILSLNNKKIYGTIMDLGLCEDRYNLALEVAAGPRMLSLVVEDDKTAEDCIKLLKKDKLGVAMFLPLNKIRNRNMPSNFNTLAKSCHGRAIDLIKFKPKYQKAFEYVFGNTLVIEDINTARKLGIGSARMVTLTGDLIEQSGAMHGGYRKINTGLSFKDEPQSLNKISENVANLEKKVTFLEKNKVELEDKYYQLKKDKSELESIIIQKERSVAAEDPVYLKNKQNELSNLLNNINEKNFLLNKELSSIENQISEFKKRRNSFTKSLQSKKDSDSLNKLQENEDALNDIKDSILIIKSELKNIDTQIKSIHLPEKDRITKIIKQHEKELVSFSEEELSTKKIIESINKELYEKESESKKFHANIKNLSNKRNKMNEELEDRENSLLILRTKIHEKEQKLNDYALDKAKVIAELEGLKKEFEPYTGAQIRKNISDSEIKDEISKFGKMVESLGNINMRALDLYEEIEKEHIKLVDKMNTLKKEKDDILNIMYEIESKKKGIFMETFEKVSNEFTRIFSKLSRKGEAYVELENTEDPLNGGVNIKVRLGTNKFLDIRSLSGGEKTLAALAFIFTMQEYSPSTFYFLDEVDAALDKTNSELLGKLVSQYSAKAQYIVISHNDNVITEATNIYGVSMQENGISKIVSLKL